MENWTNSVADLRDNESWQERVEEWNARRAQEDREFRAANPRRHTPHGRGTVEWYVPEGAEFDSDMDHGYGPRDFQYGENPWALVSEARWRILPGDVDIPTFDEEHEDWEVQVPLRRPLRPHHGVFEEYDQLILPGRELEEAFAAAGADPELQVQERVPRQRGVIRIIEEEVVPTTDTSLSRKHLKGWNKQVADLLLEIVNVYGIKCRVIDGAHLLLYPPDGKSRPFKAALARKPEAQAFYLRKFIDDWNLTPKDTEKMKTATPTPTTTFAAAMKKADEIAEEARQETVVESAAPEPTEEPQAPEEPILAASDPTDDEPADDGWEVMEGNPGWQTKDGAYRCVRCQEAGTHWATRNKNARGGHVRSAHGDGGMWSPKARAKATETRRANRMKHEVADALAIISKAVGIELPMDEKEIEHLRAEVEKQKKRADEAEARLALIRETMGL